MQASEHLKNRTEWKVEHTCKVNLQSNVYNDDIPIIQILQFLSSLPTYYLPTYYLPSYYLPTYYPPYYYPPSYDPPNYYLLTYLPTTYLPTTYLPTTHLPTTHLPTTHLPTTFLPTYVPVAEIEIDAKSKVCFAIGGIRHFFRE